MTASLAIPTRSSRHHPSTPAIQDEIADHEIADHVSARSFPCVGAKSVFNRGRCRIGHYPALGSPAAALAVWKDLLTFSSAYPAPLDEPASFVAVFAPAGPEVLHPGGDAEEAFEQALWTQLQRMHDIDRHDYAWDPLVSHDPEDPAFSFSIGGRGYYIVGLHPDASRQSRRTPRPTLVFNLHEQFEALRQSGRYAGLKGAIRRRDVALQGSLNPMLDDHGRSSEARQYSGRGVEAGWRCPFHRRG